MPRTKLSAHTDAQKRFYNSHKGAGLRAVWLLHAGGAPCRNQPTHHVTATERRGLIQHQGAAGPAHGSENSKRRHDQIVGDVAMIWFFAYVGVQQNNCRSHSSTTRAALQGRASKIFTLGVLKSLDVSLQFLESLKCKA